MLMGSWLSRLGTRAAAGGERRRNCRQLPRKFKSTCAQLLAGCSCPQSCWSVQTARETHLHLALLPKLAIQQPPCIQARIAAVRVWSRQQGRGDRETGTEVRHEHGWMGEQFNKHNMRVRGLVLRADGGQRAAGMMLCCVRLLHLLRAEQPCR